MSPGARNPKKVQSKEPKNIVGPQVIRLRNKIGLSQSGLAAKCQRMGWDISRGIIAAIEGRVRCVTDREFVLLCQVFGVSLEELLPGRPVRSTAAVERVRRKSSSRIS